MLLGDDVPADREPETGPFSGWLGRKERLKQLFPDLGRNSATIVAHADFDRVSEIVCGYLQRRPVIGPGAVALSLVGGVEAVAEQVEQHAGNLLRRQLDRYDGGVEIAFQGDVEIRVLRAGTVIGEV